MSDSEDARSPVSQDGALHESTENDNPNTTQLQSDDNQENDIDGNDDADMDDLFGDEDGDVDAAPSRKRRLDDEELDSGDDMDRNDRMLEDEPDTLQDQPDELAVAEVELARHAKLKGSDGELYLLVNSATTGIEGEAFDPNSFQPPTTYHRSNAPPQSNFSAAQTAASTIRWRRNPNDSSKLQSNSRIIRWSDGSLTLQIGSDATTQYQLPPKIWAPSQIRPRKPTPISKMPKKGIQPNIDRKQRRQQEKHCYLASVDESLNIARVTNHITARLDVMTKTDVDNDQTIVNLKQKLELQKQEERNMEMVATLEDPEIAMKRAEQAEKEKAKATRMREAKQQREFEKRAGAMGRAANYGRSSGMGLSRALLEDEGELGLPKKKGPPKKKAKRDQYYDEDEDLGRGHTREDEYGDEGDNFIATSDEEEEVEGGDDEDEEEELADEDAEGEEDEPVQSVEKPEEAAAASSSRRRRQVIDDDDDE